MSRTALDAALGELAAQLEQADLELGVFADAEIAAVTEPTHPQSRLVPLTAFDVLEADEQARALEAARESLTERGYLVEGDPPSVVDELAALLEFRQNPSAIVVVDVVSRNDESSSLYLYGIGSAGYLVEATRENEHTFTARSTGAIVRMLAGLIDPLGQAEADDGPQLERRGNEEPPPAWDSFERDVEATHTITRISCSKKTSPNVVEDSIVSFAASERGVWGYSGYEDAGGPVVSARSLSSASIEATLAAFLGAGQVAVRLG